MNLLQPLLMLKGDWHGTGLGPYGPYDFSHSVEERGRWLLLLLSQQNKTGLNGLTPRIEHVSL